MAVPQRGGSTWRGVRAPRRDVADHLRRRHSLRVHGWCIGSFTLALMWATSHAQKVLGVDSLALRYLVTLGVGYLAYLLVLRLWAAWLVRRRDEGDGWVDGGVDLSGAWPGRGSGGGPHTPGLRPGGGGDFGGAGASGDWDVGAAAHADAAGSAFKDVAGGALEVAVSAEEGAVVAVPVVAIFLIGAALLSGAGALAWLYFGWEVLLAVAVEVAFSVATARAAMGVERAGWLSAAVRLTWKPLLGALLCAVVLGAAIDHFVPHAQSLPEALRILRGR